MNNSIGKSVELDLDFLPEGSYEAEVWCDTKKSDIVPTELNKTTRTVKAGSSIKVTMSDNGGYVAVFRMK